MILSCILGCRGYCNVYCGVYWVVVFRVYCVNGFANIQSNFNITSTVVIISGKLMSREKVTFNCGILIGVQIV